MTEKEFELFCRNKLQNSDFNLGRDRKKDPTENSINHFMNQGKEPRDVDRVDDIGDLLEKESTMQTTSSTISKKTTPVDKSIITHSKGTSVSRPMICHNFAASPKKNFIPSPVKSSLWVDKYAPKKESDLIGNKSVINQFKTWLADWEDVVIKGHKKRIDFKKGGKEPPKLNARACLISGSPGIGKSSTVKVVAKQAGYHVFTLNASDTRSKLKIEAMLNDLSKCNSIAAMMGTDNPTEPSMMDKEWSMKGKTLILMDEVDGVSSSDRGGLPALIKIIKVTKMPIVCIANDVGNRKI